MSSPAHNPQLHTSPTSNLNPRARVALETTLLVHGVPRSSAPALARSLADIVRAQSATPALVGIINGAPVVGMTDDHLRTLLDAGDRVRKVNTANLGLIMSAREHGATTVSATMELAAGAGVSVFATGGLGGVHPMDIAADKPLRLDISADLLAFTRFPVAVVTAGVKSILDVASTREILETLGVPVVGYQTDAFPAFYLREARDADGAPIPGVDMRFDSIDALARFARHELARTGRGIVVCNPIPKEHELDAAQWHAWLAEAHRRVGSSAQGRDATPRVLAALHEVSGGATLRANLKLVEHNALIAGQLARALA